MKSRIKAPVQGNLQMSEVKSTGGSKICDIFVKRTMVNSASAIIDVS
jgi:hypothetical protein